MKQDTFRYAKYVAVENGTLTPQMNAQLVAGDVGVAVQVMEQRKSDLRAGKGNFLNPPSAEDIESMSESIDQAIAILKQT
jgi:hypothetical protein